MKITLVSLAAGGLIAALVLMLVAELKRPHFSPPDEPREWARQAYRETFFGSPDPFPTLSDRDPLTSERTVRFQDFGQWWKRTKPSWPP